MKISFERANSFALNHITEWLPNGKQEGDEWSAINPTRNDHKTGSFKVNLQTGAWLDGATGDKGGDCVSLYKYLNYNKCISEAHKKNYNNYESGAQCEAARFILIEYDTNYFPSNDDTFYNEEKPKKDHKNFWDDFFYCQYKINEPPFEMRDKKNTRWGDYVEEWKLNIKDRTVAIICRFEGKDGKVDIPFTLWKKGDIVKWRAKKPDGELYPLYNLDEIESRPNDTIILTEGQKAASRGKACKELSKYIFTGWFGGSNNSKSTNWESLRGRNIIFWPDADAPGRKAIAAIRTLSKEYDFNLNVVKIPSGVEKGWDLADAILSPSHDVLQIIENGNSGNNEETDGFLDNWKPPFTILGNVGDIIVFYVHRSNTILKCKGSALTKTFLLRLVDREQWGVYFEEKEKICWDAAINWIIRKSEKKGIFDVNKIRGLGAWHDEDDIIVNAGDYLLINGEKRKLEEGTGKYVYTRQKLMPYRSDSPLSTSEAKILLEITKSIRWTNNVSPYALAGWILLAPFGGLLRWRPHCWVIGPSGTGKSWLLEKIVGPMIVNEFGSRGDGQSTPAGIRQSLNNSSKAYVGDEMEAPTQKESEFIDQALALFRSSSSGTGGSTILMGTADGAGRECVIQSMALLASIGASIKQSADANRFTICEMIKLKGSQQEQREKEFRVISKLALNLTTEYARAFHSRTLNNIDEILKCIEVFRVVVGRKLRNTRDGDQLGTLLAGAYMIENEVSATEEQCIRWLRGFDFTEIQNKENKSDEQICLDYILSSKIEISNNAGRMMMTIGSCIDEYIDMTKNPNIEIDKAVSTDPDNNRALTTTSISKAFNRSGLKIRVDKDMKFHLLVANKHKFLYDALKNSAWQTTYSEILKRLENATIGNTSLRFAGVSSRYIDIELKEEEIIF